jgi:hypothetical protein
LVLGVSHPRSVKAHGNILEIALKKLSALGGDFLFLKGYNIYMEIYNKINKKRLAVRIISLILTILILNTLAMKFHWYFSIWWFDMPMHLLGGFWLGLFIIWLLKIKEISLSEIIKILLGFLIVALGWEVFEISVDRIITQNPFNTLDTLSDVCFGLGGALLSIFYFEKKIIESSKIKELKNIL